MSKRYEDMWGAQQQRVRRIVSYLRDHGQAAANYNTPFDALDEIEAEESGYVKRVKGKLSYELTEAGKKLAMSGKL